MKMNSLFSKTLAAVTITGLLLVSNACTKTSTTLATTTSASGGTSVSIDLVAQNMTFDKSSISVPAGADVTINFNNKDALPHTFSVYNNSSATLPAVFQGKAVNGPATFTYTFRAPTTPGTYFFRCDIHPAAMNGSFIVQQPAQ
jgi:plastocyanin